MRDEQPAQSTATSFDAHCQRVLRRIRLAEAARAEAGAFEVLLDHEGDRSLEGAQLLMERRERARHASAEAGEAVAELLGLAGNRIAHRLPLPKDVAHWLGRPLLASVECFLAGGAPETNRRIGLVRPAHRVKSTLGRPSVAAGTSRTTLSQSGLVRERNPRFRPGAASADGLELAAMVKREADDRRLDFSELWRDDTGLATAEKAALRQVKRELRGAIRDIALLAGLSDRTVERACEEHCGTLRMTPRSELEELARHDHAAPGREPFRPLFGGVRVKGKPAAIRLQSIAGALLATGMSPAREKWFPRALLHAAVAFGDSPNANDFDLDRLLGLIRPRGRQAR